MNKLKFEQLAGMNCHYAHYPFTYYLDSIAEVGVKNVEVWAASPHLHVDDVTHQKAQEAQIGRAHV